MLLMELFMICGHMHNFSAALLLSGTPGGHSHWKGVWGCAAVMTFFFQASYRSLAHQITVNAPLLCPLSSMFRKVLYFQPCFGQNFSSLEPNFSKFWFPRPPFLKENPLPRPYILKPAWHIPTKKKLSAHPGLVPRAYLSVMAGRELIVRCRLFFNKYHTPP